MGSLHDLLPQSVSHTVIDSNDMVMVSVLVMVMVMVL